MQLVMHRVRGRNRDAEHAHEGNPRDAGGDLEHAVAHERSERRRIVRRNARRKRPAVRRRQRELRGDERELRKRKSSVLGGEERVQVANEIDAVDRSADDERV